MKKTFVAFLLLLVAIVAGHSQGAQTVRTIDVCQLSVPQSPAIRGIKLGMTAAQVLGLFPGSEENPTILTELATAKRAPRYGSGYINLSPKVYNAGPQLAGVNQVEVRLFDDRIYSFRVQYSGQSEPGAWTHVDEFIEKLVKTYKLPAAESWGPVESAERKQLQCSGFSVTASVEGGCCPSVELSTPFPRQEMDARRKADQKKLRDTFTP